MIPSPATSATDRTASSRGTEGTRRSHDDLVGEQGKGRILDLHLDLLTASPDGLTGRRHDPDPSTDGKLGTLTRS
jgi:hypothetical protein